MLILNIAAGKFTKTIPLRESERHLSSCIVNIDTCYLNGLTPECGESEIENWLKAPYRNQTININSDIFEFMERTKIKFDRVVIYRYLEHVSFTDVEYFIYLVSTVLKKGGLVDVIVPDYSILAHELLNEEYYLNVDPMYNFEAHNTLLTTEMLNEPEDPHASIWTTYRMRRFWQLEGRFEVVKQKSEFKFDGRDIYLRSVIRRL